MLYPILPVSEVHGYKCPEMNWTEFMENMSLNNVSKFFFQTHLLTLMKFSFEAISNIIPTPISISQINYKEIT